MGLSKRERLEGPQVVGCGAGWTVVPFTESGFWNGIDLSKVWVIAGQVLRGTRLWNGDLYFSRKFCQDQFPGGSVKGKETDLGRTEDELHWTAVTRTVSVIPLGSSGAGMTFQSYPKLGQGAYQSLAEEDLTLGKVALFSQGQVLDQYVAESR